MMATGGNVLGNEISHQLAEMGDKNTEFFHATTIQRRQRNRITMLKMPNGEWSRDPIRLKQQTMDFFKSLYSIEGARNFQPVVDQCPCPVSNEMNSFLTSPATMEEVKEAVFGMGATKAPGPDGMNGHFYQQHWEDIKEDVLSTVQFFSDIGTFDPIVNRTHISLIPKVPNPETLDQFRPISLCNVIYKIISKVMANRLKPWFPEIIEMEQSAFVKGRQIQDNIMIVQEVLHQLRVRKRKKKFQAVLKLDMKKSYDRVE